MKQAPMIPTALSDILQCLLYMFGWYFILWMGRLGELMLRLRFWAEILSVPKYYLWEQSRCYPFWQCQLKRKLKESGRNFDKSFCVGHVWVPWIDWYLTGIERYHPASSIKSFAQTICCVWLFVFVLHLMLSSLWETWRSETSK